MTEKVAVLYGGNSAEREISLKTGNAVLNGLQEGGINAIGVDTKYYDVAKLKEDGFTKCFIALHGRGGEDGVIQGFLEQLKIPYTGSGVLASALAMDKIRTKLLWQSLHLPTSHFEIICVKDNIRARQSEVIEKLGLPLIVKPALEGSSVGMSRVDSLDEFSTALDLAFQYDQRVVVEPWLDGPEYTVGIVTQDTLPSIRIETPKAIFYDYDAKYLSGQTEYFCPSGLDESKEQELSTLALQAFNALGCQGWGRVDVMMDKYGEFQLLEVNTVPGMTETSLVPKAALKRGIGFTQLCVNILNADH